jgi:hypothetical protein
MTASTSYEHMRGHLSFDFGFNLDGAKPRDCQYSNGQYLPDYLRFELTSSGPYNGDRPRYKDLSLRSATLRGKKLKKDGTPGTLDKSETFYGYSIRDVPKWVLDIVERETVKLRESVLEYPDKEPS